MFGLLCRAAGCVAEMAVGVAIGAVFPRAKECNNGRQDPDYSAEEDAPILYPDDSALAPAAKQPVQEGVEHSTASASGIVNEPAARHDFPPSKLRQAAAQQSSPVHIHARAGPVQQASNNGQAGSSESTESCMAETSGVQESQEGAERTSSSSASTSDQQSVVGIIALTERMQRVEQQPCSRCREAEVNAAESITHLSSELAKAKQRISDLEKRNERIAELEAQVAALYSQAPVQEAQSSASASTSQTKDKAKPSMQPTERQEVASNSGSAAADPAMLASSGTFTADSHQAPPSGASDDPAESSTLSIMHLPKCTPGQEQWDNVHKVEHRNGSDAAGPCTPPATPDQASTTEQEVQFEDERARLLLRDGLDVLQAGRNEQALGVFSTALALRIKDAKLRCSLHNNRGLACNRLGQHITAIAECHLAEAACSTVWQIYHTCAAAFFQIGLASEALQDMRVAQAKGGVFTDRQKNAVKNLPFIEDCVDHCKVLGLGSSQPSHQCITEAYKKLSMKHHPDKVPQDQKEVATKLFKLLSVAKKQLTS